MGLFDDIHAHTWQPLALPGADVALLTPWLAHDEADALLRACLTDIPWETHRIRIFGRQVDSPRLSCWIGDADAAYVYSGTRFEPRAWIPALAALRQRLEDTCQARFNSVLANLYRDGTDSMGWHSDDEPELGAQPVIASVSLGAERMFRLRSRSMRAGRRESVGLRLPHGSLLRMAGATQRLYQHALPKAANAGARVNLTFRWVEPRARR